MGFSPIIIPPDDGVCSDWFEVDGKDVCYPRCCSTSSSQSVVLNVVLSKIQRGSGHHPRRFGAPEGALDVDGTGAGYDGLRCSSCGVGHTVRG